MSAASRCPASLLYTSESPMETFEENNLGKITLLEVPTIDDSCADEEDETATLKPRFSPLPRRRGSGSSDEGELEPPATGARKVSFADAFGFDLVSVKEFDTWDVPIIAQNPVFEMENKHVEEFFLTPCFSLPSVDGTMQKLHAQKVLLESVDLLPEITSVKGIIRVLNVSYKKQIYVRMSLDDWHSYYDLLAEYIPDSCNGDTDQFFYKISLAPPYQKEGAKIEFCICYETLIGTFWDNNDGKNYTLMCHKKEQCVESDKASEDLADKLKKSCLKSTPSKEEEDLDVFDAENPIVTEKHIPRIICLSDDTFEDNNDDKSEKKNNGSEYELEPLLNQNLMKTRITSSGEKKNMRISEQPSFPNEGQRDESMEFHNDNNTDILKQQLSECTSSDNNSQESKELNDGEVCSTMKESVQPPAGGGLTYSPNNAEYSLESYEDSPKDYLSETDEKLKYSQVADHAPGNETMEWSIISQKEKDSVSNTYDIVPETNLFQQPEVTKLTGNLDDNANPSSSQCTAHVSSMVSDSCVSMDKKMENSLLNKDNTTQISKSNYEYQLVTKDREENGTLSITSTNDKHERYSLNLTFEGELFKNTAPVNNPTHSDDTVYHFAFPGDTCLVSENQVKDINKEQDDINCSVDFQNKNMCTTFSPPCVDSEIASEICSSDVILDEKEIAGQQKEEYLSNFQMVPVQIPKQNDDISINDNSAKPIDNDHENEEKDVISSDNENIVLSESKEIYNFDCHLSKVEGKGMVTDQEDNKDMSEVCDKSDLPENEFLNQKTPQNDWLYATAHNTAKLAEDDMSHSRNDISESIPNHVSMRDKVIIAMITEEKGQSEKYTERGGGSEGPYMDFCQSANEDATEKSEIKKESALRMGNEELVKDAIFSSGGNQELTKGEITQILVEDIQQSIVAGGEDDLGADQITNAATDNASKLGILSEGRLISLDTNHVCKDQCKSPFDDVSSNIATVGESSGVQYIDTDYSNIQSSNVNSIGFTSSVNVTSASVVNIMNNETETNKKPIECMNLSEVPLVDDRIINTDGLFNIEANMEELSLGPSILISEPDDEIEAQSLEAEDLLIKQNQPEDMQQYDYHVIDREAVPDLETESDIMTSKPLHIGHVSSKVFFVIMFVIFAALMYHYDFVVCFALYLFSLYWLYWEGGRNRESMRKE
ncbi:hypothetical protein FKM82_012704 [Ascaphus truei]